MEKMISVITRPKPNGTCKAIIPIISLILCMAAVIEARAQQDTARVWTLRECMQYAVLNSPAVKRQELVNDNYRQDRVAAIGEILPSISGSTYSEWGFGRSIDPQTNTYDNTSNLNQGYGLTGSISLFGGLVNVNRIRSARIVRLRGDQELLKVKDDIAIATMLAYADVVYYSEAVRIAAEQLDQSLANLYFTRKQEELGLKGRPDVAQFEAEAASFEHLLTRRQNLLDAAVLNLKEKMNYPFREPLAVDPEIPAKSGSSGGNAAEIFLDARERLPVARIADYRLRETELSLALARGKYYPSISLSTTIGTNYFRSLGSGMYTIPFREQMRNNLGKSVWISVNIPIFGGLSRRTQVNRSRNNLLIEQQNRDENMRRLQIEIEQAVMDVEGYSREYAQAIRKMAAVDEAHKANRRRFEEGLISALELQGSTNNLHQTRVELLKVQLQYRIADRLLEYYKGKTLY